MKEYQRKSTVDNINRNTKNVLYYMARAAKAMQQGEDPVIWLAQAVNYGADLKVNYAKASDLDIDAIIDFETIYKKALKQARAEVENDD